MTSQQAVSVAATRARAAIGNVARVAAHLSDFAQLVEDYRMGRLEDPETLAGAVSALRRGMPATEALLLDAARLIQAFEVVGLVNSAGAIN